MCSSERWHCYRVGSCLKLTRRERMIIFSGIREWSGAKALFPQNTSLRWDGSNSMSNLAERMCWPLGAREVGESKWRKLESERGSGRSEGKTSPCVLSSSFYSHKSSSFEWLWRNGLWFGKSGQGSSRFSEAGEYRTVMACHAIEFNEIVMRPR